MYWNSLTLPLIALALALAGAGLLAYELNLKAQAEQAQSLVVDGKIDEKEYQNHLRIDGIQMDVYWSIQDDRIYIGLRAPSKGGWVAIGLDPEGPLMQGADIIIGYVTNGKLSLRDSYANASTSHQSDVELGGRDDILEKAGSASADGTTIEFSRKLDTGDKFDKPIRAGKSMPILVAYSTEHDFTSYHGGTRALIPQIDFFQTNAQREGATSLGLVPHLEAYEIALVTWILVLGVFGLQGLLSVVLEGHELDVNDSARASESLTALWLAALFTLLEIIWGLQFVRGLYGGAPPTVLAIYAALLLFTLAIVLLISRHAFIAAEAILQERDDHTPW